MKTHRRAGQFKLRGKKFRVLSCGCCVIEDLRDKVLKARIEKEIKDFIRV